MCGFLYGSIVIEILIGLDGRCVCCVRSIILDRCQAVRVGALMTENKGELIWRMSWKNLMCRCVMYDFTAEMFNVSRMNLVLLSCSVVPMTIVRSSLFSNCIFTSVIM